MFCSTIIPTVGRETLTRAVESVLSQHLPAADYEAIVVNDSGETLPVAKWQQSPRVRIISTHRRERSVARNAGAAAAKGRFFHFLDDDDWLASGALRCFWDLSQSSDAVWLYGVSQIVDGQQRPLVRLRHGLYGNCFVQVMAGEWIPLQASLIKANAFFAVGGFNQTITGPEDIDLLRRIVLIGDVAEMPNLVAYIERAGFGSTTNYATHPEASRVARESILDGASVLPRLRASADSSFWRGRIVRLYLTSALWNLERKRLLGATSRAALAARALGLAKLQVFSRDFWRAVAKPYVSETFSRGLCEAEASAGRSLRIS